MRKIHIVFLMLAFSSQIFLAQPLAKQPGQAQSEKTIAHKWTAKNCFEQKVFIENLGQYNLKNKATTDAILFGANQEGMQYFFTKDGIWIKRNEAVERTKRERERFEKQIGEDEKDRDGEGKKDNIVKYKFVDRFYRMEFVGGGVGTTIVSEDKVSQYYTFHTELNTNVAANGYKKITYKNLYPNIDMEFYFPEDKQGFKYNFILRPGADLSQIKINYPLNEGITLTTAGHVVIKSAFGDFTDHAPIANDINTKMPVACSFSLTRNTVSFSIPSYNKNKGIIIDPWTSTPNFAGSNDAYDVDWDLSGNVYAYGGVSPYKMVKFSPAGVQLWTYTNTFAGGGGGSYYGDFAVNRLSGSAYLVDGFNGGGAACEKVNLAGGFVVAGVSNPAFQEMWRIVYSRCTNQVVIAGGGTTSPSFTGATFDTSLTGITITNVINSPGGLHDMWGVAIDAFGSAYFATAKTQVGTLGYDNYIFKVPTPSLAPITYSVATTYSFVEVASVNYPGLGFSAPNGFNGIGMSNKTLYTYDSYVLQKWNSVTGVMTSQASVNGASQSTMTYGGLAVDECDHVFIGSSNTVKQYDGLTMTQVGSTPAAGMVYDCTLGQNNLLYTCGAGFVTASVVNLPPCTILQVTDAITNGTCTNPIGSATVTVTGGTPAYTITWNTTPVQTGSVVTNLSTGTYIATITDNSCPPLVTKDTIIVTSSSAFAATPTITNVKCKGGSNGAISIAITGTVTPTYAWSTGSTANAINGLSAGSYTCVMTGGGCNSNLVLTVTEPPALSFTLTPGTLLCFGDTTSISIALSGGTPSSTAPTYTVAWSPPNATGYAVHGLVAGGYGGVATDSNGCVIAFNTTLTQPAQILPNFVFTPACLGSPIQYTDQSSGGPFLSYAWNYGDGTGIATTQNPSHTYAAAGTYTTTLTVTNANGCTGSIPKQIIIDIPPQAAFIGDTLKGCPVHNVDFTDQSTCTAGTINMWIWSFGNGQSYIGQFPLSVDYTNTSATASANYTVTLTVVSTNGCSSSVIKNNYVTIYPHPKPCFSYASDDGQIIDVLNNTVHFYNCAQGASSVNYNLGDNFNNTGTSNYTSNLNPVHQYQNPEPNTYIVTQTVANVWGCVDSIKHPIEVKPTFTFYTPSGFSPNGDGINEYFKCTGIGIDNTTFSLVIFDRWGNKCFSSNDMETHWDGKIKTHGDVVMEDVYVWKATFRDVGGLKHEYHGTVSVLK